MGTRRFHPQLPSLQMILTRLKFAGGYQDHVSINGHQGTCNIVRDSVDAIALVTATEDGVP